MPGNTGLICLVNTAVDNILIFLSEKVWLDILCELWEMSAMQTIHIKCQALFFFWKLKTIRISSATGVFAALSVKTGVKVFYITSAVLLSFGDSDVMRTW